MGGGNEPGALRLPRCGCPGSPWPRYRGLPTVHSPPTPIFSQLVVKTGRERSVLSQRAESALPALAVTISPRVSEIKIAGTRITGVGTLRSQAGVSAGTGPPAHPQPLPRRPRPPQPAPAPGLPRVLGRSPALFQFTAAPAEAFQLIYFCTETQLATSCSWHRQSGIAGTGAQRCPLG